MFGRLSGDVEKQNGDVAAKKGSKNNIEKIYQKKSQLEHILLRPDTYIGSVEKSTETTWVYDKEKELICQKEITYVPGILIKVTKCLCYP